MLAIGGYRILPLTLSDPDDVMRLLQVRDWLAGQSWFDVTQYRVNPPFGGPMHWSRLVDLPIAAMILLFKPLFGGFLGERIALAIEPLLLVGGLFACVALAARRLGGRALALVAVLLLAVSAPVLIQFMPMRIDHHGWQIWMAALALAGAVDTDPRRGGLVAGLGIAVWLQVSSEGLPLAALWGLCFGLRFLADPRQWSRLLAFLWALAWLSLLLLIVTRGPALFIPWCDAMSPAYLLPMIAAALIVALAHSLIGDATLIRRYLVLTIAGISAVTCFLGVGRTCLAGPFATLDPIVYRLWYLSIMEGRPIWEQAPTMAAITVLPTLAGLVGAAWASWGTRGEERTAWFVSFGLAFGGLCVAIMVARSMSVAHVLAIPGNAWLLIRLYRPIADWSRSSTRILGTVALSLLTPFGLAALAAVPETVLSKPDEDRPTAIANCPDEGLAPLRALPKGVVLAPLDISANILLKTPQAVIGTSHHRNRAGMRAVIATFALPEPQARAATLSTGATYLAWCPDQNEIRQYRKGDAKAFVNDLAAGRVPNWLTPLPSSTPLIVYRVNRTRQK